MKKFYKGVIACFLFCGVLLGALGFTGCTSEKDSNGKIKILCTVFPAYDWVSNVVGDSETVELSLLVENGTDLHSFQPSFADMARIKDSDVVVYVGGESDAWVAESIETDSVAVELSKVDGVTLYEVSADSLVKAHEHEENAEGHEAHDHSSAFDEHIWLSVKNAIAATRELCNIICELDSENSKKYEKNTEAYVESLEALDGRLSSLSECISEPLIFADRFPFVYMLEDYEIDYFAAFEGCTAEADADFDTTIKLAQRLDEVSGKYLFVTESPIEKDLANSVIAQTQSKNATVIALDSMQSITRSNIDGGASYTSVMDKNVSVLEKIFKVTED